MCLSENYRCNTKQTKPFIQSNSSVYAFYNDAPPVLDYIQGYGHTKGTAWRLLISLLFWSSQTILKAAVSIATEQKVTSGQAWTESTCLLLTFACRTHLNDAHTGLCVTEWLLYVHPAGVLLSDHSQGFWLSHSVPHFPSFPERGYGYPLSGKINGQTALCVTYSYDQFQHIGEWPLIRHPNSFL